jgi:hypothetical protein
MERNKRRSQAVTGSEKLVKKPRSLAIASRGVQTGGQFAGLMSAMISDLIEGNITPQVGNAVSNAGGKLLKVVEMQYKYGTRDSNGSEGKKVLMLTGG